jgi:hypothetical protein
MIRSNYYVFLFIILFPLPFKILSDLDHSYGLLWFFIHQLYYQPYAGLLQEPFFIPDSDIGFFVEIPGRIIAPLGYITIFFLYKLVKKKSMKGRRMR